MKAEGSEEEEKKSNRPWGYPLFYELAKRLDKLSLDMDEDRKQAAEDTKKITASIEKWYYNKERDTLLGYAIDLITILYNKMYQYAISQGLSPNISIRQFIGNYKQLSTNYITASLDHLGISSTDYTTLQTSTQNRIANEYYPSWDS